MNFILGAFIGSWNSILKWRLANTLIFLKRVSVLKMASIAVTNISYCLYSGLLVCCQWKNSKKTTTNGFFLTHHLQLNYKTLNYFSNFFFPSPQISTRVVGVPCPPYHVWTHLPRALRTAFARALRVMTSWMESVEHVRT